MNKEVKKLLDQWDGTLDDHTDFEQELVRLIELVVLNVIDVVNSEVQYEAGNSVARAIEHEVKNHYGLNDERKN
jgi:hypothetical protein